jgi:AcrR family transcriptional regulator
MRLLDSSVSGASARERILHTATRLFYEQGIRATGIDRIIAEAGVAKASFYRQFPSKEELVQAFLNHRHETWMAWFDSSLVKRCESGKPSLALIADVLEEWFCDPGFRGCAFINSVAEGTPSEAVADIARAHKEALGTYLRNFIATLGHRVPKQTAQAVLLIVEGAIVRAQMTGEGAAQAAVARVLLKSL